MSRADDATAHAALPAVRTWHGRSLFGRRPWRVTLAARTVDAAVGGRTASFPYHQLRRLVRRPRAFRTRLDIVSGHETVTVRLGRRGARALERELRDRAETAVLVRLGELAASIGARAAAARTFHRSERYIATSEYRAWLAMNLSDGDELLAEYTTLATGPWSAHWSAPSTTAADSRLVEWLTSEPARVLRKRNAVFVTEELERQRQFFDTVDKQPLTDEQRRAVIVLEDRNLLIAAAGSGKTSTVVAKVVYALNTGICKPHELLVLTFNRKAAEEIRERLATLPSADAADVHVRTFHALGLRVIGKAAGRRPTISAWAADDGPAGTARFERIIDGLVDRDPAFQLDWILFRSLFHHQDAELADFTSLEEYNRYILRVGEIERDRRGIPTLGGDLVKSMQELAIANWLFVHSINYVYEHPYIYDTATAERRQYHPDFYYPDIALWHEHLALDERGDPPPLWRGDYAAGVVWKRHLHEAMGTDLLETTSAMWRAGSLFPTLERELTGRGLLLRRRSREEIDERLSALHLDAPTSLARAFIRHWKSNDMTLDEIAARASALRSRSRADAFLRVIRPIRDAYDAALRLGDEIDFDDMINLAAEHIEEGRHQHDYQLVFVDEAQDLSRARARLVRAMLDQRVATRLFAVGDDWQSIYRFAGSDVMVMRDAHLTFPGALETNFLTRTFRSNQGISDVAARFVQANPSQLRKEVRAHDATREHAVRVVLTSGREAAWSWVTQTLDTLSDAHLDALGEMATARPLSAFVLGRYNRTEPVDFASWHEWLEGLIDLRFSTFHRIKGLEADYVFVLGCDDGGFPSEVADDRLLDLVMPTAEAFDHAEERRLFYVALTRARRVAWLLADVRRPSPFITELLGDDYAPMVVAEHGADAVETCPQCGVGIIVSRVGPYSAFLACSTFPACRYRRQSASGRATDEEADRT